MGFNFFQQAQSVKVGNDALAGIKAIKATVSLRCRAVDLGIVGKYIDHREIMTLADLIVVKIMRWCNLYAARSEILINILVGNNGNGPIA